MTTGRKLLTILVVVLMTTASAEAQALEKRHQVGITAGWWNQITDARTEISPDGVTTSVGSNGLSGSIFYEHWLYEHLALDITLGGMTPSVDVSAVASGVSTETAGIGQMLFGVKYYFPASTYLTSVRPFAQAGVGPVFGYQNTIKVGSSVAIESRSETSFGGKIDAGVDFVLSRHFMAGAKVGYFVMADFSNAIGGSENYSGPEFAISFGYLFGRGVE